MGILDILGKGFKAMIDEAFTPESFKIGEKFENYVRDYIFPENYYDLIERTHSYNSNSKDFVEASIKPDFQFRDKYSKKKFCVEVKFRTGLYNGKITWCNEKQLARYKQISKEIPVFIIIGMGEKPEKPDFISLLPISEAKYVGLFPSLAEKFEIDLKKPVTSKKLWSLE